MIDPDGGGQNDHDDDEVGEDRPGGLDEPREGCVLGDRCCCPHIFHTSDECFTAEWAAEYFGDAEPERAVGDQTDISWTDATWSDVLHHEHVDQHVLRDEVLPSEPRVKIPVFLAAVARTTGGHDESRVRLTAARDGLDVIVGHGVRITVGALAFELLGERDLHLDRNRRDSSLPLRRPMSPAQAVALVGRVAVPLVRSMMLAARSLANTLGWKPAFTSSAPSKARGTLYATHRDSWTERVSIQTARSAARGASIVSRSVNAELSHRKPLATAVAPLLAPRVPLVQLVDGDTGARRERFHRAGMRLRHSPILSEAARG